MAEGKKAKRIQARKFKVNINPEEVERTWIRDDPFLTAWLNAYSMTIPDGESLIMRTIQHYADQIQDPQLKKDAAGLVGQEYTHTRGHEQFIQMLREKGYKVDRLFKFVHFLNRKILEPSSPPLVHLAFIVGIERINELIAEYTLRSGKLKDAPAAARTLYEWHFAEEIEHKSVAFDVFKGVSGNRALLGYGVFLCYLVNLTYLGFFTATFLLQDRMLFSFKTWGKAFRYFFWEEKFLPRLTRGCLQVLKKGFHPSQTDNQDLANHILRHREITVETVGGV